MFRDPTKLKVFGLADEVVQEVFLLAATIPAEDRSGLDAQLRRTALAVPLRILEGCRRGTDQAFLQGLASAAEAAADGRYLVALAGRMALLPEADAAKAGERFTHLIASLFWLKKAASRPKEQAGAEG